MKKYLLTYLLLLCLFNGYSQLRLNEMMSFNGTILSDQFGRYPDWVEIYNSGNETENMGNYWLSDDKSNVKKWQIPAAQLSADNYIIYFASGKNIEVENSYWHSIVDMGDVWRYHIPDSDIGQAWKTSTTATDSWLTGKSGIGFRDGDDSTIVDMQYSHITLYMQFAFDLADPSLVNNAALHMDYDDGFIAYLNGSEIARSSTMGNTGDVFAFDDPSLSENEAKLYQGKVPESFDIANYKDLLQTGENILAVEVHNFSLTSSDVSSIPFLVMGFASIQEEFKLGNEYIDVPNIFPHTNFTINSNGEAIYLSDNSGVILDSIAPYYVPYGYSLGRTITDPEIFGYFDEPTPGYENSVNYVSEYVSDSVFFAITGKEYDAIQQVELSTSKPEDIIYYSTDGSEPTLASSIYSESISIDSTQIIRARIIRDGMLPGPVNTKTFFTGRKPGILRVAVSTTPENLWDYYSGIYVKGPNATTRFPYRGANFWMDWEKSANLEIYDADGNEWLNQNAGLKINGRYSRGADQKSLAFYARSAYGDGSFSYQLFEKKDIDKFEAFILRNGGDDFNGAFIRDAVCGYLSEKMDIDHQAYTPATLYLNGEYFGVMSMLEKINEHFIADNNNLYSDDINLLELLGDVVDGSNTTYNAMINYFNANDMSQQANYEKAKEMMDVDNYIRYWLLQVYINNRDWPGNNIKFWSSTASDSKFRWIIFDTDCSFGHTDYPGYTMNTLGFAFGLNDDNWANGDESTVIIRSLIANEEFKNSLINQIADRMNTDLLPERIVAVIDSFQNQLSNELPYHFEKWGGSMSGWSNHIQVMKNFANERPQYMIDDVLEVFNISGTHEISVNVSDTQAGSIRVNSIVPCSYPFTGTYYDEIPIQLEAIPAPGYTFSAWKGTVVSTSKVIDHDMKSGGSFTAVFADASGLPVKVVINEINFASSPDKDTEDWVELYNNSDVSVDLEGWQLVDKSSGKMFDIAEGTIISAGGYMVFSKSQADFKKIYPELMPVLGDLNFGLNSNDDGITLLDDHKSIRDQVYFGSETPWPEGTKATGATLELIHPDLDNSLAENWKASLDNVGTPLEKNSQCSVGIEDTYELLETGVLLYPTIFSDMTNLHLSVTREERVCISVFSMTGRVLEVLEDDVLLLGEYTYHWKPTSGIVSGMYFIHVSTNSITKTYKLIYQKY